MLVRNTSVKTSHISARNENLLCEGKEGAKLWM